MIALKKIRKGGVGGKGFVTSKIKFQNCYLVAKNMIEYYFQDLKVFIAKMEH